MVGARCPSLAWLSYPFSWSPGYGPDHWQIPRLLADSLNCCAKEDHHMPDHHTVEAGKLEYDCPPSPKPVGFG